MRSITRASSHALFTVVATGAAMSVGLLPGGGEPEHPAPVLTLTESDATQADDHPAPVVATATADNSARWLAGGALTVAAVAVAAALLARRRS